MDDPNFQKSSCNASRPIFGRAHYWDLRPTKNCLNFPGNLAFVSQEGSLGSLEITEQQYGIGWNWIVVRKFFSRTKYFDQPIPSLKHYSDIVSDIPPSGIYGIFWHSFRHIFSLTFWQGLAFWPVGFWRRGPRRRRQEKAIKSRDLHLAGGEQQTWDLPALIMNRTSFQFAAHSQKSNDPGFLHEKHLQVKFWRFSCFVSLDCRQNWGSSTISGFDLGMIATRNHLVGSWWFQPLRKIFVNWDGYLQYMWEQNCARPATSHSFWSIQTLQSRKTSNDSLRSNTTQSTGKSH